MKSSQFTKHPINVTKPHLPDRKKLSGMIDQIYDNRWLTNNGPLVQLLRERLEDYLEVSNILLVANGTLALQLALKLLAASKRVVTTPFSFVATTSSLVWSNILPVFSDISPNSFNIDPCSLSIPIVSDADAIMPTHVFGNPCEVEAIEGIANSCRTPILYDAAHAFGVRYKGRSLLQYGDLSALSFHATKLFHTVEGGALVIRDSALYELAEEMVNFGYRNGSISSLGVNMKMNEIQAAMGLCVLEDMPVVLEKREALYNRYREALHDLVQLQVIDDDVEYNYHYFPVVMLSESDLISMMNRMQSENVFPRRYFYPSLDDLPYVHDETPCPISRDIASRILCLPLYPDLSLQDQDRVIDLVRRSAVTWL